MLNKNSLTKTITSIPKQVTKTYKNFFKSASVDNKENKQRSSNINSTSSIKKINELKSGKRNFTQMSQEGIIDKTKQTTIKAKLDEMYRIYDQNFHNKNHKNNLIQLIEQENTKQMTLDLSGLIPKSFNSLGAYILKQEKFWILWLENKREVKLSQLVDICNAAITNISTGLLVKKYFNTVVNNIPRKEITDYCKLNNIKQTFGVGYDYMLTNSKGTSYETKQKKVTNSLNKSVTKSPLITNNELILQTVVKSKTKSICPGTNQQPIESDYVNFTITTPDVCNVKKLIPNNANNANNGNNYTMSKEYVIDTKTIIKDIEKISSELKEDFAKLEKSAEFKKIGHPQEAEEFLTQGEDLHLPLKQKVEEKQVIANKYNSIDNKATESVLINFIEENKNTNDKELLELSPNLAQSDQIKHSEDCQPEELITCSGHAYVKEDLPLNQPQDKESVTIPDIQNIERSNNTEDKFIKSEQKELPRVKSLIIKLERSNVKEPSSEVKNVEPIHLQFGTHETQSLHYNTQKNFSEDIAPFHSNASPVIEKSIHDEVIDSYEKHLREIAKKRGEDPEKVIRFSNYNQQSDNDDEEEQDETQEENDKLLSGESKENSHTEEGNKKSRKGKSKGKGRNKSVKRKQKKTKKNK